MWRAAGGAGTYVEGRWYYYPEETESGLLAGHDSHEVFLSEHSSGPMAVDDTGPLDGPAAVLAWPEYQLWLDGATNDLVLTLALALALGLTLTLAPTTSPSLALTPKPGPDLNANPKPEPLQGRRRDLRVPRVVPPRLWRVPAALRRELACRG